MIWIFGYGSLIWRPGFAYQERRPGLLIGYHRAFCRYSHRHRGTPEQPGLVVGLREGGRCMGMAYSIPPEDEGEILQYLDEREGDGYLRRRLELQLRDESPPPTVTAWVYVPNPGHRSYFGSEDTHRLVELVAMGQGESGTALDYLRNLMENLRAMNTAEPELAAILHKAEAYRARLATMD